MLRITRHETLISHALLQVYVTYSGDWQIVALLVQNFR